MASATITPARTRVVRDTIPGRTTNTVAVREDGHIFIAHLNDDWTVCNDMVLANILCENR